MPNLFLVRHGESTYNRDNRFTGWIDAPLTEKGIQEAEAVAEKLRGYEFEKAYTSRLQRASVSLSLLLAALHRPNIPVIQSEALNERQYGDLQGLNKEEAALRFGNEIVHWWRRSYDVAPPHGESLKDASERVLPFFHSVIMEDIQHRMNVMVLAHGNTLRAIVKELDHLSDDQIINVYIETGEVIVYNFDEQNNVQLKRIL
jgi:2,3-bisphosphoglycerate-dependent phosphoglycerate mutase